MWRQNKKMVNTKLMIIILVVLVCLLLSYIVIDKYSQQQFLKGFETGNKETIFQIAQQSLSCQIVPLIVNNQTIKLININCLNQ